MTAQFSPDRVYRYALWRTWDASNGSRVMFIGLNPSTADETQDDPTIRRCVGFAKRLGAGQMIMANLFAFRATDPFTMLKLVHTDPVGPDNDAWLARLAEHAGIIVAAWGAHGGHRHRDEQVIGMFSDRLFALGVTKDGHPRHPLYLRADAELVRYGRRTTEVGV